MMAMYVLLKNITVRDEDIKLAIITGQSGTSGKATPQSLTSFFCHISC